jgi:nuclear GTP-binding protein
MDMYRLMEVYEIPKFNNPDEFIMQIAFKKGKLAKGGVADFSGAAIAILRDFVDGKIPFFVYPPPVPEQEVSELRVLNSLEEGLDVDFQDDSEAQGEGIDVAMKE